MSQREQRNPLQRLEQESAKSMLHKPPAALTGPMKKITANIETGVWGCVDSSFAAYAVKYRKRAVVAGSGIQVFVQEGGSLR